VRAHRDFLFTLGHLIPKGTDVFFLHCGAESLEPAIGSVPEDLRSESSPAAANAKTKVGTWVPEDVGKFKPEHSIAGPMLVFGLGPRGCFGRRPAYLELRLVIVLLIWNFEFQALPAYLNTYAAVDKLTHQPQQVYIRLATA
jgi:cytochrome P450